MATSTAPRNPPTPIRAIPSTLLSRTAPTIPPASQLYEPLVKAVLRHRQYKIFLHSAALSWLLVSAWRTWSEGDRDFWLLPIRPSTLAYTLATFATGALPIVVLRKSHVAASPTPATSPSKTLAGAFQKQSTVHALLTYLASSLSLAALHLFITTSYDATADPHARISLFVKSRKHPYYLNGHLIYLLFSQAFIALACLVRCVLLDRFAVRWGASLTARKEKLQSFGLARAVTVTLTTFVYTLIATVLYLGVFAFGRSVVLPTFYQLPFVPRLLKPFTAHFLRGQWTPLLLTRHWSLVSRAFYLALTTVGIWEFAESAFDSILAESISVSAHTADPGLTLVSGITSTDPYLKHFAYAELREFTTEDSPAAAQRRSALFADQKYNPNMWSTLSREALLTLGRDYQLFLRRGQPAPPPAAAPAAAPKPSTPLPGHATPLLRASVFKTAQTSPLRASLDMLASDGPLATAVSETAEAGASHLPELFRSVLPSTPPAPASAAIETAKMAEVSVARVVSETKGVWREGVGKTLVGFLPKGVAEAGAQMRTWWTRERVHRVAETSLPNRYVDALAAEVLCRLTCASLTEDAYGVVQRDIPKIVEALLSFLTALEEFHTELNAKYALPPLEQLQQLSAKDVAEKELLALEAARASEVCGVVTDAIKEGVVQIVRTFGEKLAAFRFPPRIAKKLQGFVDYN
ncbi:nucleoporin protein Ndc1-Nup [Dichomitus squalens]|uniref:Nucleoporin protein Ndc1-Nup n=1 Tax=Dichomitus squalens TaxID=114155 RepID=A0A4Q9MKS7_9APHY|nr:nucleoporin protein Ndc1-Nup [Dichomitus squalens]